MGKQLPHDVSVPGARGGHEGGLSTRLSSLGIRAGLQQLRNHCLASIETRERKRSDAVPVHGKHVGACANQEVRHVHVIAVYGPVQSSRSVNLRSIHVAALVEQRAHGRSVAVLDSFDQRTVLPGRTHARHGEQCHDQTPRQEYSRHVNSSPLQPNGSLKSGSLKSTLPVLSPSRSG